MLRAISAFTVLLLVLTALPGYALDAKKSCGWMQLPLMQFQYVSQGYHDGHHGADLVAPLGSLVLAAQDGTVSYADWNGPYGRMIEIDHEDGISTRYGHLSVIMSTIKPGTVVFQGQAIGKIGTTGISTGPHLHFEVRSNGDHTDPLPWLGVTKCR